MVWVDKTQDFRHLLSTPLAGPPTFKHHCVSYCAKQVFSDGLNLEKALK